MEMQTENTVNINGRKKTKILKVGITYDLKSDYVFKKDEPADANAEFDNPRTIETVTEALKSHGREVVPIGNVYNLLKNINDLGVDIVLNIAEGVGGRNRESQVPIILDMFNMPYVGSDALTLALTLDKIMAKKVLISEGIPTPKFIEIKEQKDLDDVSLEFPLIVKPRHEGSSKGIGDEAIVKDMPALRKRSLWLVDTYKQPALVEEFISGKELTVAVVGNGPYEALPTVQIKIDGKTDVGDLFYTFSRISSNAVEYVCPAQIPDALNKKISDIALRAYKAVGCKDFGRVDFRLDKEGNPYILEINPLPCLSIEDVFTFIGKALGRTYDDMINRILDYALNRYGMI